MKLQETISLSSIYTREEDFSKDLADNIDALKVGEFEDAEMESNVGRRRADIVAVGESGTLVVENQFDRADWDHWGRLEAYARLKKADVAVLVAEEFEELMTVTCNLRNEDSDIDWYLIQAQSNTHEELSFHHIARPAIDIQTERGEYSGFWEPICNGNGLFAGLSVSFNSIRRCIRRVSIVLCLRNQRCYIRLYFQDANHRKKVMTLFPESDYDYEYHDSPRQTQVIFPVLDKGRNHQDDWDDIREKLVTKGTDIYDKIGESDLQYKVE